MHAQYKKLVPRIPLFNKTYCEFPQRTGKVKCATPLHRHEHHEIFKKKNKLFAQVHVVTDILYGT